MDFLCDVGLVCDDIGIENVRRKIMGAEAAPDGVAIRIIFVY